MSPVVSLDIERLTVVRRGESYEVELAIVGHGMRDTLKIEAKTLKTAFNKAITGLSEALSR